MVQKPLKNFMPSCYRLEFLLKMEPPFCSVRGGVAVERVSMRRLLRLGRASASPATEEGTPAEDTAARDDKPEAPRQHDEEDEKGFFLT